MGEREQRELLATGNTVIDREHRTLVELLDKVRQISQSTDQNVEIMRALTAMYLYAKDHFFDEEGLMERLGYPERELHTRQHKEFLEKTHGLTDACLEGALKFDQLADFLTGWLTRHVEEEDIRIIQFAKAKCAAET